jgi:D-proline reductase (dithiol) PrdB
LVRLTDLTEADALHLLSKDCPRFETEPFRGGPALAQRRVAIVTTAGLHRCDDAVFDLRDTGYRVIPGGTAGADLVMSHSSVNYDRTGWQQDVNTVFPLDRLHSMQKVGEIGSVANFHYALNGAGWEPHEIEPTCETLAGFLKADAVDAVVVIPV